MDIPKLTTKQYNAWLFGDTYIQDALPHLTKDERAFVETGITPEEWEATFK